MHENRFKNNLARKESRQKANKSHPKVETAVCRICLSEEDPKEK
jgi:hypothetical protein